MSRFKTVLIITLINITFHNCHRIRDSGLPDKLPNIVKKCAIKPDYQFTREDLLEYKRGCNNDDIHLNVTQLICKYNYPVKEYVVETCDGYLLKVIRIPNEGGPVVFLMHGLLCSADDFVTVGVGSALPYLLYEQGYDVWLGNARGNKYSRAHVTLSPGSSQFWDFTWNEIGLYDLPAMIDFALHMSGKPDLVYIGHSQGTTAFYVLCSQIDCRPKVSLMISMAPVAWVKHIISPIFRILALFGGVLDVLEKLIGPHEFLPSNPFMRLLSDVLCPNELLATELCSNFGFLLFGFDYGQMNITNLPVLYGHLPAGTSSKDFMHYLQEINSGCFRRYDYGLKNIKEYKALSPPPYDVAKITVPIALYYGSNDWLAVYADIKYLIKLLPNIVKICRVPYDKFNHMDFLWAKDVKTLLYDDMIAFMNKMSLTNDAKCNCE